MGEPLGHSVEGAAHDSQGPAGRGFFRPASARTRALQSIRRHPRSATDSQSVTWGDSMSDQLGALTIIFTETYYWITVVFMFLIGL